MAFTGDTPAVTDLTSFIVALSVQSQLAFHLLFLP